MVERSARRVGNCVRRVAAITTLAALAALTACGGSETPIAGGAPGPGDGRTTEGTTPATRIAVNTVDDDEGTPTDGGRLTFGLAAETDGWSPANSRWSASGYIVGMSVFDPLVAYDRDLRPVPFLARSLTPSADNRTWTIGLRPGITFHDGEPVDAAAVKKNLDAQKTSGLTGETLAYVTSITVTSETEVVLTMSKPWATFPHILASQIGAIAAPAMIDKGADGARSPIGTGPFVFREWTVDSSLTVDRNDRYWRDGLPHLDGITFEVHTDNQSRAQSLESGDIDILETSDPSTILRFRDATAEPDTRFSMYTDSDSDGAEIFLAFNAAVPPFDDPVARQAVARAVDNDALSRDVFQGVFPPADGPFSPTSPYVAPDAAPPPPDLAAARELAARYEEAHGSPLRFRLNITPAPETRQLGEAIQAQMAEAGIAVELHQVEQVSFIVDTIAGNYEATFFTLFSAPHLDATYVFLASPAKPVGALSLNFTRLPEPELTPLRSAMDEMRASPVHADQVRALAEVQRVLADRLPYVFLVRQTTAIVASKAVHGVRSLRLPDDSGAPGVDGLVKAAPFTAGIWLDA